MSKAHLVMEYVNMTQKTPQSLEYFKRKKQVPTHHRKAIIKKEIYEKHYLNGVSYINPNIDALLKKHNHNSIEKIRRVLASKSQCYVR